MLENIGSVEDPEVYKKEPEPRTRTPAHTLGFPGVIG
jgi:hypothetical protein